MRLIDVHSHLEWDKFNKNLDSVIQRSKDAGIIAIITSSVTTKLGYKVLKIAEKYKNYVFPCCGFGPSETKRNPDSFQAYLKFAKENSDKFLAIGEVGLDYYWIKDKNQRKYSEECFLKAINLSNELKKPIIIHCRDAEKRTIELLEEHYIGNKVHMHCFSGPKDLIERGLNNGWMFSVPTSVVNRKYHRILAEVVPIEQMMLETDAPFLSPIKDKKMNESKNIVLSAEFISKMKGIDIELLAEITTKNALEFYSIKL
ncbi:MAG: TatD family hydrolase [archaeon]|nr:TatD family hydrolase [archaeon]